ncbi:MAG: HipA domain-containing protein [Clostridia bacterium]|jgi:serine/threonine-protein kinase HipA
MNCLCCGKPLPSDSLYDTALSWHNACVRKFFFTNKPPIIDITDKELEQYAKENIDKGITIPGIQKKLSLHLIRYGNPRLTLLNYPSGYILKPQVKEYQSLPEAEYLAMLMAVKSGIIAVPFALIRMHDSSLAYITRRIDRILSNKIKVEPRMLAMEDFCQLSERLTQDKYRGSYEQCAKVVSRYSTNTGLDLSELFIRIVFSFVIGNSDMHLKNLSLIETAPNSQKYVLSPVYDILPVNLILPEDKDQFALTLNGKKRNICRKDFLVFAEKADIPYKSAEKIINSIISLKELYLSMCHDSYLPDYMKSEFEKLITDRISVLIG